MREVLARMGSLGFGAAQLGNLSRVLDDATSRAAVDTAWERGIRYFDTAPHYGLGLSERRLGAALAHRPRNELVLSTKVGRVLEPNPGYTPGDLDSQGFAVPATARRRWDFSRDGILRSLESSLDRLGMDRIDIAYLHDPDDHWDDASTTGVAALVELRDQGVVGAIGVGMNQSAMPARFVSERDIDIVMLAGRYTLLDQRALDDLLPAAAVGRVAIVAAGVYNSGILSLEQVSDAAAYDYTRAPREVVEHARRIAYVAADHGVTLPEAAVAVPLHAPRRTHRCAGHAHTEPGGGRCRTRASRRARSAVGRPRRGIPHRPPLRTRSAASSRRSELVKFSRLGHPGAEVPVVHHDGHVLDLRPLTADIDPDFLASEPVARVREAIDDGRLEPLTNAETLRVGSPIVRPGKLICVGLNYAGHARETGADIPAEPVMFLKGSDTVVGPFDEILIPRRSVKTDWEVELGVVIGRTARYLEQDDDPLAHVAGYVISHDVSEREFQLERGVINTGTPAGVALGLEGNPYLREGDVVELAIEGLGSARQTVAQA